MTSPGAGRLASRDYQRSKMLSITCGPTPTPDLSPVREAADRRELHRRPSDPSDRAVSESDRECFLRREGVLSLLCSAPEAAGRRSGSPRALPVAATRQPTRETRQRCGRCLTRGRGSWPTVRGSTGPKLVRPFGEERVGKL